MSIYESEWWRRPGVIFSHGFLNVSQLFSIISICLIVSSFSDFFYTILQK